MQPALVLRLGCGPSLVTLYSSLAPSLCASCRGCSRDARPANFSPAPRVPDRRNSPDAAPAIAFESAACSRCGIPEAGRSVAVDDASKGEIRPRKRGTCDGRSLAGAPRHPIPPRTTFRRTESTAPATPPRRRKKNRLCGRRKKIPPHSAARKPAGPPVRSDQHQTGPRKKEEYILVTAYFV
jgi:hypothetical protein